MHQRHIGGVDHDVPPAADTIGVEGRDPGLRRKWYCDPCYRNLLLTAAANGRDTFDGTH
jgi:hypothetical protein